MTLFSLSVFAWTEHSLITQPVLQTMPEISHKEPVEVETLAEFVSAEAQGLSLLLAEDELWLRQANPYYTPQPESLKFVASGSKEQLLRGFMRAIRINSETRINPFLQILPDSRYTNAATSQTLSTRLGRKVRRLASHEVAVFDDLSYYDQLTFIELKEGQKVRPLDVLVTANDEPDNGLDIGLFSDNQTEFGGAYGFGPQPFGDLNLAYGSQAPFHMGFYHESPILYALAPFLRNTFPDYRVHTFKKLAEYAFATGHDYWGWRFMGWAMHYIGDISQPYHARLQPGVGTWSTLWTNIQDVIGFPESKNDAIQLLSNRHMVIENVLHALARKAYLTNDFSSPIFVALTQQVNIPDYDESTFSAVFAKTSFDKSDELAELLTRWVPHKLVSDPSFQLSNSPEANDLLRLIENEYGEEAIQKLSDLLAACMMDHNQNIRSFTYSILGGLQD